MDEILLMTTAIQELTLAVKQLRQVLPEAPVERNELTLDEAASLLRVHPQTVHGYRKKYWEEGVHFFPQGKGHLYNRELLLDWQRNRSAPDQHQLAIAAYIQRAQPKKR
ncbi:MAG TPA: helix-turn-helix domain-containing protein [Stenomitos sp.]